MKRSKLAYYLALLGKHYSPAAHAVACVLIFCIVILVTVDVIGRSFFSSILIADEISRFMLIASAFLALAYTQRTGKHIEVKLLTERLSYRRRKQLQVATSIVSILFLSWLAWTTWGYVKILIVGQVFSETFLQVPMWIPMLFVPLGFSLIAIEILIELAKNLMNYPGITQDIK